MSDPVTNKDELEVEEQTLEEVAEDPPGEADQPGGSEEVTGTIDEEATPDAETDQAGAQAEVAQKVSSEDTEVIALREEFESLNDRHLRLAAEFNNFRRRSEQERLGAWSRAQADLVARFLDVLDDLHRVAELDLTNATVDGILEGIDLVEKKFVRVLEESGAEMIDPVGEPFDPEIMEAMMRVPAESEEQEDTVAQVFQKGYTLKGVLVRPARVSVYTA